MRGTVSAGMALALHERGLMSAFDAVYGSSAGAITGAWLLSSEPERLRGWAHPDYARTMIRWSALLHRRPVADVRTLVEVVYQTEWPMDFESILASPIEFHPLATDAATGQVTDLRPMISDPVELRLALRASAALPFLAGPPVRLRGRRYYDAGVAETIPFRTPVDQGATHILVLRSRRPLDLTDDSAAGGPDVIAGEAADAGWAESESESETVEAVEAVEALTERWAAGDVSPATGGVEAMDGQPITDPENGMADIGTADIGDPSDQVKLDLVEVIEVRADPAANAGFDPQDALGRRDGGGDAGIDDRGEADGQRDTGRRIATARAARAAAAGRAAIAVRAAAGRAAIAGRAANVGRAATVSHAATVSRAAVAARAATASARSAAALRALRQAQRRRRIAQIGQHRPPPSYLLLTRTALRNESPEFRTALLTRSARTAADIEAIDDWQVEGRAFAIFPPTSVPPVSRLTTDSVLLEAALESGREAVDEVFGQ